MATCAEMISIYHRWAWLFTWRFVKYRCDHIGKFTRA